MGLRAYLMVNVREDLPQGDFVNIMRELEDTPGVDFVDPVIGSKDLVIMIDAPVTVEAIANKIRSYGWVRNTEVLRIVSVHERHRMPKSHYSHSPVQPEFQTN